MFHGSCEPDKDRNVFHSIFLAIGCLSALFNFGIFLMVCYFLKKHKHFRTPCNIILWGIFLANSLANIVAFPIRGIGAYCNVHTFGSCQFSVAVTRFAGNISSGLLLMLTIERCTKIAFHRFYRRMFSRKRTKIGILCMYVASFVLSFLIELNWHSILNFPSNFIYKKCFYTMIFSNSYGIFVELGLQVAPLLATFAIHAFLFHYVRKNLIDFSMEHNYNINSLITNPSRRLRRRKTRVEIKLAISAFLLCGVYAIFVFPIVIVDLIQMFEGALEYPTTTDIPDLALQFAVGMVILYPSVEGLVLLFTNPSVFKYVYAFLRQQHPVESTVSYSQT